MERCFGVAFDVGTTTIAGFLWDLNEKHQIGALAKSNPQRYFGPDVISRIQFAGESKENLNVLRNKALMCMDDIVRQLSKENGIDKESIIKIVLVGNTAMSHIVMGVDPGSLAYAPFTPIFTGMVQGGAYDLGLAINRDASFTILPGIGGHVGSDITAGLLVSGIADSDKAGLLIDIGTNGEIVMSAGGRVIACSTAAGPAFEGVGITCGMRAAPGAIERIVFEKDDIGIKTIGDISPIGICGSGIIDGIAELLKTGMVDKSGRMLYPEEITENCVSYNYIERVRWGKDCLEFAVAPGRNSNDIVITQKDIRQVQLAKGAIRGGIDILMKELDIGKDEIEQIFIAGAFGSFIKKESAAAIGLLPQADTTMVTYLGNAAGAGAGMALAFVEEERRACSIVKKIEHLELSTHPDFQERFLHAMDF